MALDPATAAFNFGTAALEFLCTPVGQEIAKDNHDRVHRVFDRIENFFVKIQGAAAAPPATPVPAPAPTSIGAK